MSTLSQINYKLHDGFLLAVSLVLKIILDTEDTQMNKSEHKVAIKTNTNYET